jgi:branched-chain amino acid aminotransferase
MSPIPATDWIWRDGTFIPWADAQVHLLSHSMQFGSAAFEGIRCYDTPKGPAIFRLREHLTRLFNSSKIYRTEIPYTMDEMVAACRALVVKNNMGACYLRPMVVRGYGAAGMVPYDSPIEVYLPCWNWGAYLGPEALEQGVDVCVSSWARFAANTVPSLAKVAGNYLGGQLVKMEAMANGFAEAIALNTQGTVSEGSGQNVFLVVDGDLVTTPLDGSLLGGITRASIIAIAEREGLRVREQVIPREMLYTADELFFTGTAAELTPVRSVDRIKVGAGKVGPLTKRLQTAFLDIAHGRVEDTFGWLTPVR